MGWSSQMWEPEASVEAPAEMPELLIALLPEFLLCESLLLAVSVNDPSKAIV
jgi:hypothetical protein